MKEKIQEKLFVWGQLHKQCQELEAQLEFQSQQANGSDRAAIQVKLKALEAQAAAAFNEASAALCGKESKAEPAEGH